MVGVVVLVLVVLGILCRPQGLEFHSLLLLLLLLLLFLPGICAFPICLASVVPFIYFIFAELCLSV